MAESLPVPSKRKKTEEEDVFSRFQTEFMKENPQFLDYLFGLNDFFYSLKAYQIKSCNAAEPAFGVCFTNSLCALIPAKEYCKFAFGNFFVDAFRMIKSYVKDSIIPEDAKDKLPLITLLKFLLDFDFENMEKPLFDLQCMCENETDLTVLLASHFFSQLSISPKYTIDNSKSGKSQRCPCGKLHQSINFGDTSIGNPEVWYGRLDIIMEGSEVIISVDGHKDTACSDVDSVTEVKPRSIVNDVSIGGTVSQIAAKTIVHSFYYRNIHPVEKNSLIPCIGVCNDGLIFYFYDSVNDVLLGSTLIPLFPKNKSKGDHIQTIIATWMILNHKYLCNGLSRSELDLPKAGFFDLCKDKLEIYKTELKRGNVEMKQDYPNLDPLLFTSDKVIIDREFDSM